MVHLGLLFQRRLKLLCSNKLIQVSLSSKKSLFLITPKRGLNKDSSKKEEKRAGPIFSILQSSSVKPKPEVVPQISINTAESQQNENGIIPQESKTENIEKRQKVEETKEVVISKEIKTEQIDIKGSQSKLEEIKNTVVNHEDRTLEDDIKEVKVDKKQAKKKVVRRKRNSKAQSKAKEAKTEQIPENILKE
eukprot:CAMPEP_0205803536 /NCGR_PEP_ID=MMETSP0205-20121125/6223_1 /ASSEMBLY_ACC=CAM_ASM_000278 /TAXON_ID=36767 /ORGANISM="Euplotes focardii, Strain TN1" /LENGTH=191 /DNA_ID=CAMNT_0053071779 /DNA_START=53 /DNA_END=628 /DNA_ORIENTATION=-